MPTCVGSIKNGGPNSYKFQGNGENGNYEKLLASVKFPIWDYDYDGLIANIKLIISESGVKDKWQIPDANLDGFLMSVRSHYQGSWF